MERGIYIRIKKMYRQTISNHPFCLMKLNGLKERYHFNEIAPKDTKMCLFVFSRS